MKDILKRVVGIHDRIVNDVPQLRRGKAWCHKCGREFNVDAAACLREGWPKCCGATVSTDSPAERVAQSSNKDGETRP